MENTKKELRFWKIKNGEVIQTVEKKKGRGNKFAGICFAAYVVMIVAMCFGVSALAAAATDPLTVVNNLSNFIFALIRAIGLILLGWGVVQVGLSLQSHDPSQRSNGFLTLAGGIIITFAQEILNLITGVQ